MTEPLALASRRGRWVVAATVLGSSMALLDGTVVNIALPHIGEDLNSGVAGLQWTLSGYTLALASLILLGGASAIGGVGGGYSCGGRSGSRSRRCCAELHLTSHFW